MRRLKQKHTFSLKKLVKMHKQLEPNAVVNMVGQYIKHTLEPPTLED